jgi:hypothetical protein
MNEQQKIIIRRSGCEANRTSVRSQWHIMMKNWRPREMMDENPTGWRLVAIITTLSLSLRGGSDYGLWIVYNNTTKTIVFVIHHHDNSKERSGSGSIQLLPIRVWARCECGVWVRLRAIGTSVRKTSRFESGGSRLVTKSEQTKNWSAEHHWEILKFSERLVQPRD